jgi:hypothetical protein
VGQIVALTNRRVEGLTALPILIRGSWRTRPERRWFGQVVAEEYLVALGVAVVNGELHWFKSDRRFKMPPSLLSLTPSGPGSSQVGVGCGVAGAGCYYETTLRSPEYVPSLPDHLDLHTGCLHRLGTVEGTPAIEFFVLYLSRGDIRSMRKGLWRIRHSLRPVVPEPYRTWLAPGRHGSTAPI